MRCSLSVILVSRCPATLVIFLIGYRRIVTLLVTVIG